MSLLFPSFPFLSLSFPSFPVLSLPFPSFPFLSLPFPSFPFLSLSLFLSLSFPSFPVLSLPFPSFPFLSLPFPFFPFLSLSFPSFPVLSLPFPSFPFLTLPFPSFPFLSLSFPSFPVLSLPFPSWPFRSLPFPSCPFCSLPFPSFPFLSLAPTPSAHHRSKQLAPDAVNQRNKNPSIEDAFGKKWWRQRQMNVFWTKALFQMQKQPLKIARFDQAKPSATSSSGRSALVGGLRGLRTRDRIRQNHSCRKISLPFAICKMRSWASQSLQSARVWQQWWGPHAHAAHVNIIKNLFWRSEKHGWLSFALSHWQVCRRQYSGQLSRLRLPNCHSVGWAGSWQAVQVLAVETTHFSPQSTSMFRFWGSMSVRASQTLQMPLQNDEIMLGALTWQWNHASTSRVLRFYNMITRTSHVVVTLYNSKGFLSLAPYSVCFARSMQVAEATNRIGEIVFTVQRAMSMKVPRWVCRNLLRSCCQAEPLVVA